jgi:hypothetical protein
VKVPGYWRLGRMPAPDAIIKLLPECEQFSTIFRVSNFAQPSL